MESNPYSFIRIINPEYREEVKTKPNSRERFNNVRKQYEIFQNAGILFQDQEEHLYLYKQTKGQHEFVGIIAGASVEEYKKDHIKKHEATLTSRESMFTDYLEIVGYNAEPVLLSYPSNDKLKTVYAEIMQDRPEYEFSTTDEIKHELWILSSGHESQVKDLFEQIPDLYIADGHHRSASSTRLADKLNEQHCQTHNHNFFLAFIMDEDTMEILEFNRLIKKLSISESELLSQLEPNFEIENLTSGSLPTKEHEIIMNLKEKWYKLVCKQHIIDTEHPVKCLDAEILTQYILTPILGIQDLKTDQNIEFVGGTLGLKAISEPIHSHKAELGFLLYPVTMKQVKRVADNQMIMPPKSTWVEPKLRSGLTIYTINE